MPPAITVILCTHNPNRCYLDQTLSALKAQSLSLEQWEFLFIDNASNQRLASEIDLSWHPNARHIREEQLGLTPARLRGIQEATAETLVFVDDDNVLDSGYLEITLRISKDFPLLGAWGGQVVGKFEVPPPDWIKPYLPYLALREFDHDQWSNLLHQHETTPCGAGICVRQVVAKKYAEYINHDPNRKGLDRKGGLMMSCGDTDLAFTACDIGLGTGQFKDLKLTHLMPANRLSEDYIVRLMEGMIYSHTLLDSFRGKLPPLQNAAVKPRFFGLGAKVREYCQLRKLSLIERRIYHAKNRGYALAIQELSAART